MAPIEGDGESNCSEQLQEQADPARQSSLLAQAEPDQGRAFEGEDATGGARRQRQRHRQRRESQGKHGERLAKHAHAAQQAGRAQQIDDAKHECGNRQRRALPFEQGTLQGKGGQRIAEHQRAVDGTALLRRAFQRVEDRHDKVDREKQQHERLGAVEQARPIGEHAPDRADGISEKESNQVQHAPGALPGDGEDGDVEQGVVGKQGDMVAAASRDQDRRGKAGEDAEHGEGQCILQHGQHADAGD